MLRAKIILIIAALFLAAPISETVITASPTLSAKKTKTTKSAKTAKSKKTAKTTKTANKQAKKTTTKSKSVAKKKVASKNTQKRTKPVSRQTKKATKAKTHSKKTAVHSRKTTVKSKKQATSRAKLGIDLSHHNSLGLWNHINSNGHIKGKVTSNHKPAMHHLSNSKQLSFVYIKLTEGATVRDNLARSHYKEAKQRGLRVGFYHFFSLTSSPEAQFNNFVNSMRAMPNTDLPPVIDFEEITGKIKSKSQKETVYRNLCTLDRLMKNRFKKTPLVYTNRKEYHMFFEGNKRFRGRLWTPRGYANPSISQWWIKINGIPVDFNVKH